uniref:Uncharacterized protein n=1 Tax=Palpitomonas bilix TaxID=652834 RepID=A0A7S3G533_9EUKA|mmetsp:Transcript_2991/g.5815  ORF Transcript_2991/g.5815 Transcript_2991/m.5815 type:complete len:285 (+) Transcript_2991:207-1061(+)
MTTANTSELMPLPSLLTEGITVQRLPFCETQGQFGSSARCSDLDSSFSSSLQQQTVKWSEDRFWAQQHMSAAPPCLGEQLQRLETFREQQPNSYMSAPFQPDPFESRGQTGMSVSQPPGYAEFAPYRRRSPLPPQPSQNVQGSYCDQTKKLEATQEKPVLKTESLRVVVPMGQFKALYRGVALANTLTEEEKKWDDKVRRDFLLDARALHTTELTVKASQTLWHIPLAKAVKLPRGVPNGYKVEIRFTRNARSGTVRHYFLFHSPSGTTYRTMRQVQAAEGFSL